MIDNRLVIAEHLVIILPVSEHDSYLMLYFTVRIWPNRSKQCRPKCDAAKHGISSGSTLFATHPAILDTTLDGKFYFSNFLIKYRRELRCLNTKGKYGKVINTKIKWSIISKSVTIIIFV